MWSVTSLKNESVIVKNWTPSVLITYGSSKKKYFGLSHYIAWGVFFLLSAVSSLCKDAKFGRMTQKILIWDARWRPPGCVFQQTHPSWGLTFPTPFPPDESWWKTMSQFWNNPLENRGDFQKMTVRPSELDPCYRSQTHAFHLIFRIWQRKWFWSSL